jgi:hypothetical protein
VHLGLSAGDAFAAHGSAARRNPKNVLTLSKLKTLKLLKLKVAYRIEPFVAIC